MKRHKNAKDQSVFAEPHLRQQKFEADPSEAKAAQKLQAEGKQLTELEHINHSVWDEPGMESHPAAQTEHAQKQKFGAYFARRAAEIPASQSWLITLVLIVFAGPIAILGVFAQSFFGGATTMFGLVYIVVFGPLIEEMLKVAGPYYIIESKPWLFSSPIQPVLCAAAAGVVFGTIENLIYLNVYIPNPSDAIVYWRWLVCTPLHTIWSTIAGVGLALSWRRGLADAKRPDSSISNPWLTAAVIGHGVYNGFAVLLDGTGMFN